MSHVWCLEGKMKGPLLHMRDTVFFLCSFTHIYEGNLKSCKSAVSFLLLFLVSCSYFQKFSEITAKNSFFEDGMLL